MQFRPPFTCAPLSWLYNVGVPVEVVLLVAAVERDVLNDGVGEVLLQRGLVTRHSLVHQPHLQKQCVSVSVCQCANLTMDALRGLKCLGLTSSLMACGSICMRETSG